MKCVFFTQKRSTQDSYIYGIVRKPGDFFIISKGTEVPCLFIFSVFTLKYFRLYKSINRYLTNMINQKYVAMINTGINTANVFFKIFVYIIMAPLRSVHTPRYLLCDAVRYHIQVQILT